MADARSAAAAPSSGLAVEGVVPAGTPVRPGALRILETAVVAFAERGYHGVSVRDLTGAVGIKAASFYAHFESKEALLHEIMRLGHETHHAAVQAALLDAGADPRDQLRAAIRANVLFHATHPLLTIVCNSELHALAPEHRGDIIAMRRQAGVLVAAIIERGTSMGVFECADPWLAMSAIAGMGVRVAWWFRAPAPGGESPLNSYPTAAVAWLPETDHSAEAIADGYADIALLVVRAKGGPT